MKRIVLVLILIAIAYAAAEMYLVSDAEIIIDGRFQRIALIAGLAGVLASVIGSSGGGAARKAALICGIAASLLVLVLASFPASLATELNDDELVRRFRMLYYDNQLFKNEYLGVRCLQYPTDQWVMQEIISDVRPDFIIETGTWSGATSLFYAHLLDQVNPAGKVVTIDIEPHGKRAPLNPTWDRHVEFILGDSVGDETLEKVHELVNHGTVLVTLDSNHESKHVARELELYSPFVSLGSYIVVQDTHLGGNPNQHPSVDNPGPLPAVREFLANHPEFQVDHERERHMLTQNPSGYLKRIR